MLNYSKKITVSVLGRDQISLTVQHNAIHKLSYRDNQMATIFRQKDLCNKSHASTVVQCTVTRPIAASYGKGLNLVLHRNQTFSKMSYKICMFYNVGDLNECADFHCN